jgi:hypothetical protein
MAFALSACATQPPATGFDPPGFFSGILHGFLILPAFIGSLFLDIRIYAFPNTGVGYDFGYLIGCSIVIGGAVAGK